MTRSGFIFECLQFFGFGAFIVCNKQRLGKENDQLAEIGIDAEATVTNNPLEATARNPQRSSSVILSKELRSEFMYVDIAVRDNDVLMRCGRCVIYSRLVEGRFPIADWNESGRI